MKSLLCHGFFCSCVEIKKAEPGDIFKPGPPQCKKIKCHKVIIKAIKSWLNEHSMDVPSGREQIHPQHTVLLEQRWVDWLYEL